MLILIFFTSFGYGCFEYHEHPQNEITDLRSHKLLECLEFVNVERFGAFDLSLEGR